MKFGEFIAFIFSLYEISFHLVIGQTVNIEKSDCTKFYNFLNGDSHNYSNSCCSKSGIICDNEGYIKIISKYI